MSGKVLVTGASGFLGYHIIHAAIEKGLIVYAAVRRKSNTDHLKALPVQYIFLNYESEQELASQLAENKIDYIIHAAAVTKTTKQEEYDQVNVTYTSNLAKAAEASGNGFKKMVFISSLAAVGPLSDNSTVITEATPPRPVTAYGRSKLLAEKELAAIPIQITILRPTAIYGPRDKDIFIVINTINKGLDPYIGNIQQQVSFVHAKDVAAIAVKALTINNTTGIYNITDGNAYNRYHFADITKSLLKRKAFRFHLPMPLVRSLAFFLETVNRWLHKPAVINREKLHELAAINWVCDISKAKRELAFEPVFDLQSGLEDSISWYKKNKWL